MFYNVPKKTETSNERKQQLAYCKICKLHKYHYKNGVLCSLTNEVANFKNECLSMQIDFDLVDDYEVDIHNQILAYIKRNYNLRFLKQENYIRPNHTIQQKYHTKENTYNVNFKRPFGLGGLATFSLFVVAAAFFSIQAVESANVKILLGLICFIFFCVSIIGMVRDYYSPLKNALVVTEEAIIIDGKKLYWNDIVEYRIIKASKGQEKTYDLIIGTINEGIQKFNLMYLHIPVDRVIEILNLNRKEYFTHFERHLPEIF